MKHLKKLIDVKLAKALKEVNTILEIANYAVEGEYNYGQYSDLFKTIENFLIDEINIDS